MTISPVRTAAVIDDDRRVLASLANLLASGGYGARIYKSPTDFFADDYGDLICIVTDLGMKPVDGMEVLERVVRSDPTLPVILITGKPSEHTDDYYLQKGAFGFFRKPIDGEALLGLLDSIA